MTDQTNETRDQRVKKLRAALNLHVARKTGPITAAATAPIDPSTLSDADLVDLERSLGGRKF